MCKTIVVRNTVINNFYKVWWKNIYNTICKFTAQTLWQNQNYNSTKLWKQLNWHEIYRLSYNKAYADLLSKQSKFAFVIQIYIPKDKNIIKLQYNKKELASMIALSKFLKKTYIPTFIFCNPKGFLKGYNKWSVNDVITLKLNIEQDLLKKNLGIINFKIKLKNDNLILDFCNPSYEKPSKYRSSGVLPYIQLIYNVEKYRLGILAQNISYSKYKTYSLKRIIKGYYQL